MAKRAPTISPTTIAMTPVPKPSHSKKPTPSE